MELRMRQLFVLVVGLLLAVAPRALAQAQTDEPAQTPQAGDEWIEPITGMEFVWVPGGCYEMGCGEWAGECREDELPVHEVCVDGFWMGKYEVTQGQWEQLMFPHYPVPDEQKRLPVININGNYINSFISNMQSATSFMYDFRLPTEAEWEYACRSAGRDELYSGGSESNKFAWYSENSDENRHPVGEKEPNGIGLYDMSGNVWEVVQDMYSQNAYETHSHYNPLNTESSNHIQQVLRGGSWSFPSDCTRCYMRTAATPNRFPPNDVGFRIAATFSSNAEGINLNGVQLEMER